MPILFLILVIAGVGSKAFSKLCSNILSQNSVSKYSLVLVINSFVACLFFAFSSGLRIFANGVTLIYSVAYALIAMISIVSGVVVYRYATVSNVNILSSSCGMICTAVVGWMLFMEEVVVSGVIRLAIMLIAIALVFLDQKSGGIANTEKKKKCNNIALALMIAIISASACANTVVLKAFAMSERVTDENSFFFLTNVFLLVASLIVFAVACLRKQGEFRDAVKLLRPNKIIAIAGNTVCSNIGSLVCVLIVAQLDVSIYSPVSSALGIIAGVIGSLIFKEKLGVFAYVAVAVALIAVII